METLSIEERYQEDKANWRNERYHLEQKIANLRKEVHRLVQVQPKKIKNKPPRRTNGFTPPSRLVRR